jgi:hypothetical protein
MPLPWLMAWAIRVLIRPTRHPALASAEAMIDAAREAVWSNVYRAIKWGVVFSRRPPVCQPKDAEQNRCVMNTLNDLRAEWIETRRGLGRHIVDIENGTKIHPIDQDSAQATAELLERLRRYRADVESWLLHLPTEAD